MQRHAFLNLEGAAHTDDRIVRAQGLEELAPAAARVEAAGVLDVADRAFEAPTRGMQVLGA
jgi:hypothetical protein